MKNLIDAGRLGRGGRRAIGSFGSGGREAKDRFERESEARGSCLERKSAFFADI